jgi:hypothetical protein
MRRPSGVVRPLGGWEPAPASPSGSGYHFKSTTNQKETSVVQVKSPWGFLNLPWNSRRVSRHVFDN